LSLSEIGEFGLINRLKELVGPPADGESWIGDDTAVLRAPAGTLLFTTDIMIEGIHFDLQLASPFDIGFKSIAVNASDIAAMGGTPRRALCAFGIKRGIDLKWAEQLYAGMRECADMFDMAVVGGDVSASDCLVISVSMIGNPAGRLTIPRSGARVGDAICVTGRLGASAAGYRLLRAGKREPDDLVAAHLRPTARVRETQILRKFLPTAMIDVSDGFAADLGHICESSEVGALIDVASLPLVDVGGLDLDRDALELALHGGEDYELLFTIPSERADQAIEAVRRGTGTAVTRIGSVVASAKGMRMIHDDVDEVLEPRGWDHLR
jgi:thiamine-monophosphate kinase